MKKTLKITLIIIGSVALLILVPPIFMPSSYQATSSIVIESNSYNVFPYFADLKNWEKWSPWRDKDTTAAYKYSINTYGAGSSMEWDSKNEELGNGKMTTVQFKKFRHINYTIKRIKPFESNSGGQMIVEKLNDHQVKVTWTNTGKLKWPLDRWFNSVMSFKKMFEKDFEKGLQNLKKVVETTPSKKLPAVAPVSMELPDQHIFSIMFETVLNKEISDKIEESYGTIIKTIQSNDVLMKEEPPVCLFYSHNKTTSKMRPGIIVQGCSVVLTNGVECIPLKAGKVLRFEYLGGYNNMEPFYDAIEIYLDENKINKRENYTWESYVTDPTLEPDSSKWITHIYVPIK
jgi:effector-binding domain-containing protein